MPLTLTEPKQVGDLDTNSYDTVKIFDIHCSINGRVGRFNHQLGYMDGDNFVAGKLDKVIWEVQDIGEETTFTDMVSLPATTDETLWDHMARAMYTYLLSIPEAEGGFQGLGSIT